MTFDELAEELGERIFSIMRISDEGIRISQNKSRWLAVAKDYARYGAEGGNTPSESIEKLLKKING